MKESDIQKKILDWLRQNGFYAFKVMVANRNGILDIAGCTPRGIFFGIEVKMVGNTTSKLQDYNISQIRKKGGIAFVAYDLETVIAELGEYL